MDHDNHEYEDPTMNKTRIQISDVDYIDVTTWEAGGGISGEVVSNLRGEDRENKEQADAAISGVESFVLAYACEAGVDACLEESFVFALRTTLETIENYF